MVYDYELVNKMLIACWSSLLGLSRKLRLWAGRHYVFVGMSIGADNAG